MTVVHCGVLVRNRLLDAQVAARAVEALARVWPDAVPTKTGGSEPLRDKVGGDLATHVAAHWSIPFLWEAGKKIRGSGWQATFPTDLGILNTAVAVEDLDAAQTRALALIGTWCSELGGEFGYVHVLNDEEVARGRMRRTVHSVRRDEHYVSIMNPRLAKGFPDIFWATVVGPRFVHGDVRAQAASCGAAGVEACGDGFLVRTTGRLADVLSGYAEFSRVRECLLSTVAR